MKKNAFNRSDETTTKAFHAFKEAITTISILSTLDFTKEFIDASGKGLGAILMQGGRPISFMTQALVIQEKAKSVYERELMKIAIALQKWCHYQLGRHFKIHIDKKSLKHLTEQKIIN